MESSKPGDRHTSGRTSALFELVFVVGSPGAGKGTLCKRLANDTGWHHISVGDHLRELCANPERTTLGESLGGLSFSQFHIALQERKLLPSESIVDIVAQKLKHEHIHGHQRFLIDGFPRDRETADLFDWQVCKPSAVLFFDCPKNVAKARFVDRKRGDDDGDVFEKRYAEHQTLNTPVLEHYGKIVKQLDTDGEEAETYERLLGIAKEGMVGGGSSEISLN